MFFLRAGIVEKLSSAWASLDELNKRVATDDGGDNEHLGLWRGSGQIWSISKFSPYSGWEESILLGPVCEHLPVIIGILLSYNDLATHHEVELLRVVTEWMLFSDFESILCVVKEGKGDGLSPFKKCRTFDLGDLLSDCNVLVCYWDMYWWRSWAPSACQRWSSSSQPEEWGSLKWASNKIIRQIIL